MLRLNITYDELNFLSKTGGSLPAVALCLMPCRLQTKSTLQNPMPHQNHTISLEHMFPLFYDLSMDLEIPSGKNQASDQK